MGGGSKGDELAHVTQVGEVHVGDTGVVDDFGGSSSLCSWGSSILVDRSGGSLGLRGGRKEIGRAHV